MGWTQPTPASVTSGFVISHVAGTGVAGYSGDSVPASGAKLAGPSNSAFDKQGNFYVAEMENHRIRKITPGGTISTFAGVGGSPDYTGDGGPATSAKLSTVSSMDFDSKGNMYFADLDNDVVRKIDTSGKITRFAGRGSGSNADGDNALDAGFASIYEVKVDAQDNVYIADFDVHVVYKVTPAGIMTRIAGTGVNGNSGDFGQARDANLGAPYGLVFDPAGNMYISDYTKDIIRKVAPNGVITSIAGTGVGTYSGDGGPAASAAMDGPGPMVMDAAGNLYIAEWDNGIIRKIDTGGVITTVAGTAGVSGNTGDGGDAKAALFKTPSGISISPTGELYVSDYEDATVRKLTIAGFQSTTVSASVNPSFTFTVAARNTSCAGQTPTGVSSANSLDLGHLSGSSAGVAALDLAVATNSAQGVEVFVRKTGALGDGRGNTIPDVAGSGDWFDSHPFPTAGSAAFGYTMDWLPADSWIPITAVGHDQLSLTGPGSNMACVVFRAQASPSTAAGTYSTTVVYTATPYF